MDYWKNRQDLPYYRDAARLVREWCPSANSIVDIGGGPTLFIDRFSWIPKRTVVDRVAYPIWSDHSPAVNHIVGEFPDVRPEQHDVVLCLQVIEHVDEQTRQEFASALFETARQLVILSIPYKWRHGAEHHRGLSEEHLRRWTGKKPHEMVVSGGLRLVAAYSLSSEFKMAAIRNRPLACSLHY